MLSTGRAGKEWGGTNNIDDSGWRRKQWNKESHDCLSDFIAPTTQEFTGTIFFQPLQGQDTGSVDKFVGSLDELFLQLLELNFLFRPIPGSSSGVD